MTEYCAFFAPISGNGPEVKVYIDATSQSDAWNRANSEFEKQVINDPARVGLYQGQEAHEMRPRLYLSRVTRVKYFLNGTRNI